MLTRVKRLFKQAQAKLVRLCAAELSELWEKMYTLPNDVVPKDLKLQTIPCIDEEATQF